MTTIDDVYKERNQVVAFLARTLFVAFPEKVSVQRHEGENWDDDWRTVVYMNLGKNKQVSWHFHESEVHLLQGIPNLNFDWDGHTSEEKYKRVESICKIEGEGSV